MSSRLCNRCHADLHTEDSGALIFCQHCGVPQIVLSEELREQFEQQQSAAQNPSQAGEPGAPPIDLAMPVADSTAVVWSRALSLAALAGIVFAALMLFTFALPPFSLLALLWLFGAPIILLGIYSARNPATRITTGFGARLGFLAGLSIGVAEVLVQTFTLLVQRFILHRSATFDQQFTVILDQVERQQLSRIPPDQVADVQHLFSYASIPEFRIGLLLCGFVIVLAMFAAYSTLAGAFSGLLRSRSATR